MKRILFFLILLITTLFSCRNDDNKYIDSLIKAKNDEIFEKYSFNTNVKKMVVLLSKDANRFFDLLIQDEFKYADSIIVLAKKVNDFFVVNEIERNKSEQSLRKCDLKLLQYQLLCSIQNNYNEWLFTSTGIGPVINYDKKIKLGDTLKVDLLMGFTNLYNEYYATIANDTLSNFMPVFKVCPTKIGKQEIDGTMNYNKRGKLMPFPFKIVFFVER